MEFTSNDINVSADVPPAIDVEMNDVTEGTLNKNKIIGDTQSSGDTTEISNANASIVDFKCQIIEEDIDDHR